MICLEVSDRQHASTRGRRSSDHRYLWRPTTAASSCVRSRGGLTTTV